MQALINVLMQKGNFDPNKYYIFLVSEPENPVQLGIMPFFQNFAFVFVDKVSQAQTFTKTAGHELGHGAFGLEHPFTRHEGIEEFATENLMTWHPTSTKLYKYQWDLIQHPVCFLDGDCGTGVTAGMERDMSFEPVVKLDVMKVISQNNNNPSGYLTDVEKINPGAFIPVNNDDDCDYSEDKNNTTPEVVGETDLLTITVRGIAKEKGYFHFETNNDNIKIWSSPNRVVQQKTTAPNAANLTANDVFSASANDLTFYVEGINTGICNLTLVWTKGSKGNSTRYTDNVNFTVFNKEGPRYVPENSRYSYKVTGSVAGSWIANNKCTIVTQTGNNVEVDWGEGPDVGQLIYKVNNNYFWNFETDIVDVKISQVDGQPYLQRGSIVPDNKPHFEFIQAASSAYSAYFKSGLIMTAGNELTQAAIVYRTKITLTGPIRNGISDRGIKKMQVGWLQNGSLGTVQTVYSQNPDTPNIPPPAPDTPSIELPSIWYVDNEVTAINKFYKYLGYDGAVQSNCITVPAGLINSANDLITSDNPDLAMRMKKIGTPDSVVNTALLQRSNGIEEIKFRIFICARTIDKSNGADLIYTPYKYATWTCHLEDTGNNIIPSLYDTPPKPGYNPNDPSLPANSIITLPVGGNIQNWQRGVNPNPITTGEPMNNAANIAESYFNIN